MLPPGHISLRWHIATFALVLAGLSAFATKTSAQEQERTLLDRIQHPNMDLHAQGFEKSFETKASGSGRQANVHPFAFGGRTVDTKGGDGAFHARTFNDGRGNFRTENYAVKRATAVDRQALPQADRTFATGAVPVREDRMANRSMAGNRDYVDSTKPFLVPGKRQDTMDDLRTQKNLSIDEVREILNKSR